ncbi:MAG TPA: DUF4252 domain-containing protein [Ignavibacteriaceae bacterium]|nr:DUF4252 domain-containing protein [Ignavibacteriaceae bacterium]
MKNVIKMFVVIFLIAASNSFAQKDDNYSKYPGYFNFGDLSHFIQGDNVTEVNIDSHLLGMMSGSAEDSNDDFSNIVHGLKLVKVYSFDVKMKEQKELLSKMNKMDENLTSNNWNRIVKVKEPGEYTFVYIKPAVNNKEISGLVVATFEKDGKATFVNIVGNINMSDIGKLSHKFNIPSLDGKDNKKVN